MVLVGKPEGKGLIERHGRGSKVNIKKKKSQTKGM
jgi:hypothetical protein